jgi:hypothetical protein
LLSPHPYNRVQLAVDFSGRNETILIIAPGCDVDHQAAVENLLGIPEIETAFA